MLFPICQRYIFESYSQPNLGNDVNTECCFRYVKDTFLKAIHNKLPKQNFLMLLFPICQRYIFESYSQPPPLPSVRKLRCFRYVKDTFLKAIHNIPDRLEFPSELFPICQRYIFESYSQPGHQ